MVATLYLVWRLRSAAASQRRGSARERLADDSGVAMMEFLLVTPFLLGTTLLLLQTTLVFTGLFYVQYAASAAARSAIVYIPMDSSEPSNTIFTTRGSDKFDRIESAAMLAVMPVSGRENGGVVVSSEVVNGLNEMYRARGESAPAWVDNLIAQRLNYAMNHTEVTLYRMRARTPETVEFIEIESGAAISPKEAIAAEVRHEFALSIPLASRVFASVGESGSYSPASRDSETPSPPGQWIVINARAVLTNEGIDRNLPPKPEVPRY